MREVERRGVEGTGGISEEVGRPDTVGCGRAVVGRHWEMLKENKTISKVLSSKVPSASVVSGAEEHQR